MNDHDSAASFDPDALPRREDGLAVLSNDAMRARRRPLPVLWMWAWESAAGLAFAWPLAAIVDGYYGGHPHGDAALWNPGALELFDLVVRMAVMRSGLLALAAIILVATAILGLLPTGAMLASIAFVTRDRHAPPVRAAFARAAQAFPTLIALLAGTVSLQLSVLGIGMMFVTGVSAGLGSVLGEARADQLAVILGLSFLALACVLGVAHDIARAAALRFRVAAIRAVRLSINTIRRAPLPILFSWAWRWTAGLLPVAMGSLVAERSGITTGGALVALFIVHQLIVGARVALRASWYAKALRAADHAHRVVRVSTPSMP